MWAENGLGIETAMFTFQCDDSVECEFWKRSKSDFERGLLKWKIR